MSNFFAEFTQKRVLLSVNGIYKHRASQAAPAIHATVSKDYFVVNAKAAFFIWQSKLSVFVQADNLSDVKYSDLLGAQMPGRWFMGGLSLRL